MANEKSSWYNHINSSVIDKWRIWPRALITLYGIMFWRTTEWFGLYVGSGGSKGKE